MFMRLVSSIDAGKESQRDSASMLEGQIPARLARDLSQLQLVDESRVGRGKEQNVFLDRRGQMQQNHDLGNTGRSAL